ncbi:MAG: hypothetical protein ACQET8_23090 [Bacillota bacterium]
MAKKDLDLTNLNVGFVITGLIGMVEDEGMTPHEAFEMLDLIKRQTFHALADIKAGRG